jgi:hypothetical protein
MPNEVFIGVDVCKPRLDLMILLAPTPAPNGLGALGKYAKTDAIDAVILAEFAARM